MANNTNPITSDSPKLIYRFYEGWKKAPVALAIAVGTIIALGGVLAYLSHAGIIPAHSIGFLGGMSEHSIYALLATGGGLTLGGIVLASFMLHRFVRFKAMVDSAINDTSEDLATKIQDFFRLTADQDKSYKLISGGKKDFTIYLIRDKASETATTEVCRTSGNITSSSSFITQRQAFLQRNQYKIYN